MIAVVILKIKKSKGETTFFIFGGIFGAAAEMFSIHFGAWNYNSPNMYNIPVWLIPLWGIAAIYMSRIRKHLG